MKTKPNFLLPLGILVILAIQVALSSLAFNNDLWSFKNWAESITAFGPLNLYTRNFSPWAHANYPPLAMMLFWISASLSKHVYWVVSFKFWGILLQTSVVGYLLYHQHKLSALAVLLNPGLWYNTIFWGQTDSLMASIIFFSLFLSGSPIVSLTLLTVAALIKQSAIIFIPVVGYVALAKHPFQKILLALSLSGLIAYFSFLPFFSSLNPLDYIKFYNQIMQGQAHQHQASASALNFWFAVGLYKQSDSILVAGVSLRLIGLLMFALLTVCILITLHRLHSKHQHHYLYAAGLINLAGFLFLTRMHERHLLPTLLLSVPLIKKHLGWVWYIPLSAIHLFNLYGIWNMPESKWANIILFNWGRELAAISLVLGAFALIHFFTLPSPKNS